MILLNNTRVEFGSFPNGETKMNEAQINESLMYNNHIDFKYGNDGDLIKLMFVQKYLNGKGINPTVRLLYMPYSRMDRSENGSAFTLKYVTDFINSLNFQNVTVVEPHSDVTLALLDRVEATYPTIDMLEVVMEEINFDKESDYLFFPDCGSQKRYSKLRGYKQIVGYKQRDFQTGEILELQVVGDFVKGKNVLIVDDLTSYGTTFIKSAEKLKEMGFEKVYLFITHSEQAIYKGSIFKTDYIEKVFTTNTMLDKSENENLVVFEI